MNDNKNTNTGKKTGEIVLNIGEISEIAPGRGIEPGIELTGNVLIDIYNRINGYFIQMTRIKVSEKMVFYQLLSTMLNAGISLLKSLDLLSEQLKNPKFKKIIWELANNIEKGSNFSQALAMFPNVFDEAEVGMVTAGEASGKMNEVMKNLSLQLEKSSSIMSKIKGAMFYPAMIVTVMAGAVILILTMVVPKLKSLFTQGGKELPTSTKMLLAASDYLQNDWYVIVIIVAAIVVMFIAWKRTDSGKYTWDEIKLHIPVFGSLLRKTALARFSSTLANLFSSGVPIVRSLRITSDAVGNEVYKKRILSAAEDVQRGIPLGENLSGDEFIFPSMVVYMISIGEKTAQLGELCEKIAGFYEEEVDTTVKSFSKLLEPLIIVAMSTGIGFVVIAIMEPIMQISDIGGGM